MRLLFYKTELAWPRVSGHDVHAYQLMRALAARGHDIALSTQEEPAAAALEHLPLARRSTLVGRTGSAAPVRALTRLQERFRSYWGVEPARVAALAEDVATFHADALVAVGLDALPYLAAAPNVCRVWYAADEWFIHHASLLRLTEPSTWGSLRDGAVKLAYERAFSSMTDRAWVVSGADRRALTRLAGYRSVDIIPNGVDANYYRRPDIAIRPRSCVFWGRLDFEPNLQGLQWFVRQVWPRVRAACPDATFAILGASPTEAARALGSHPGIELHADLPDLRAPIASNSVAVLPFVSGGGIKNKLLEAASLAMPIICTPRACSGLRDPDPPFIATTDPARWSSELVRLWADAADRERLGTAARAWVLERHTWDAAARDAIDGLLQSIPGVSDPVSHGISVKDSA